MLTTELKSVRHISIKLLIISTLAIAIQSSWFRSSQSPLLSPSTHLLMADFEASTTKIEKDITPEGILEQVAATLLEETPKIDIAAKNFIAYYVGKQVASFPEALRVMQSVLRHLQKAELLPLIEWLDAVPQGENQTGIDRIDQVTKYKVVLSLRKRIAHKGSRVSKTFGKSFFTDTNIWPRVRAACLSELGDSEVTACMLDTFERSFLSFSCESKEIEELQTLVWSADFNAVLRDRREKRVTEASERANYTSMCEEGDGEGEQDDVGANKLVQTVRERFSSSATSTVLDDEQPTNNDGGAWKQYCSELNRRMQRLSELCPGGFALSAEEKAYRACRGCPVPREHLPMVKLPLRFVLVRDQLIGCTISSADTAVLVCELNQYWKQAGITFIPTSEPVEVFFPDGTAHGKAVCDLKDSIWSLCRGEDGKMTGKGLRKEVFLGHLMKDPPFDAHSAFNIWIFDFLGHGSQGVCIDRDSHSVIIGQRSNKGYPEIVFRPLPCLGKTMAHELGHALGLDHPEGCRFIDGIPFCGTKKNLMTGGSDRRGGGGDYLEDWQIIVTRENAKLSGFLSRDDEYMH